VIVQGFSYWHWSATDYPSIAETETPHAQKREQQLKVFYTDPDQPRWPWSATNYSKVFHADPGKPVIIQGFPRWPW